MISALALFLFSYFAFKTRNQSEIEKPLIIVNGIIAPSLSKSKIAEPMLKNKLIADGIAKAHPMKRIGEGKDAAAMAKFLLTDESSWITGQIIGVDGGRSKLTWS